MHSCAAHGILKGRTAVCFDLDGTLVDSMWVWSAVDEQFLGRRNIPVPPNLSTDLGVRSFREAALYFIERFHLSESPEEIQKEWDDLAVQNYRTKVQLKPGVLPFLEYLKEHSIRVGLATSSTPALINAVFEHYQLQPYFQAVRVSNEFERGKPAPDIFLKVCRPGQPNISQAPARLGDGAFQGDAAPPSRHARAPWASDGLGCGGLGCGGRCSQVAEDLLEAGDCTSQPGPLFPIEPRLHAVFDSSQCQRLQHLGAQCVLFEDHPGAAQGGKEAGMYVVGVRDGASPCYWERLRKTADCTIGSFDELLAPCPHADQEALPPPSN
ncbi:putative HAD family phosphatase [Paratrimastix pyriformis]|uniref:HAD family phosphatase n=1 Tax=Paratrimastix pyriformis TaxID=342808 RepID=A0ABQ8URV7_9EUKA|nr:putative HAD family phosphatase [Paratrimastix pyriformis]